MHSISLPSWITERRALLPRVMRLELRKTALLVIDLQTYFVAAGNLATVPNVLDTIPNVNRLAQTLRGRGGHVVWIRHTFSDTPPFAVPAWYDSAGAGYVREGKTHLVPGAQGHELYSQLDVASADLVVDKHRFSPFHPNSSNLNDQLRRRNIDTLIVTGILTNCCCESTARDAIALDYQVLFASDATAAFTDEEHNASLLNLAVTFVDVRTTEQILGLICAAEPE
jgi:ureidoacrylate peracid hydrolase